jgi:hypothetical protein
MNSLPEPDHSSIMEPELTLGEQWDSHALAELIRGHSSHDTSPAFLFLGRHEASLLRQHLGSAFGEESVSTLNKLYYMGLEVIEIDMDRFLRVAGRKITRTLQDPIARRRAWQEHELDSLWTLRIA